MIFSCLEEIELLAASSGKDVGRFLFEERKESVKSLDRNSSYVVTLDGKFYFFDRTGKIVPPPDLSWIFDFGSVPDLPEYRKLEIPEGVSVIGEKTFLNSVLEEISLPESLERISWMAFGFCKRLRKVIIPKNVSYIGPFAFIGLCRENAAIFSGCDESANLSSLHFNVFSQCIFRHVSY